jgi:hypothetical protein
MVSSDPHEAPTISPLNAGSLVASWSLPVGDVEQTSTIGPPSAWTFLIFPFAQKPIQAPSGEKNGLPAPSLPFTSIASPLSRGRR